MSCINVHRRMLARGICGDEHGGVAGESVRSQIDRYVYVNCLTGMIAFPDRFHD
jgi:hypothetical protein